MAGAFAEIPGEHLDVEVIACRVSHAKELMVALDLSEREAVREVLIEVPAIGLVNRCCSLDRFIHASCPWTLNITNRDAASVTAMENPVVVLV